MTLTEVAVSAAVLSLSVQMSLQSWWALARTESRTVQREALLLELDQRVLASRRILRSRANQLTHGGPEQRCRLDPEAVETALDPMFPAQPKLDRVVSLASDRRSVWLVWRRGMPDGHPPLQRQLLLTAAGLGLCGDRP